MATKVLWHGIFVNRKHEQVHVERTFIAVDMIEILYLISEEITHQVVVGNDFIEGEIKDIQEI